MNTLYPIFLKTEHIHFLLIGGGYVATEKIHFLLKSSPECCITVVANIFSDDFMNEIKDKKATITLINRKFLEIDFLNKDLVICAIDDKEKSAEIYALAKQRHLLINVADKPTLCDFYLGGIVTKGNLKIAISTNGKSPTLAKRMREFFEDVFPDDIDELLINLEYYRSKLKFNLQNKIRHLNNITENFKKKGF
ncbi:MAG: bifunctional precorrin-2 dehydrogenase/sirohydrochlorin ferrochelatase [Solirubrobacteraceae bacterium]